MHCQHSFRRKTVLLLFLCSLTLTPFLAQGGSRTLPAGSYIIPMDPCWQPNKECFTSVIVRGTDGRNYKLIRTHTSSNNDKPTTGTNWARYWARGGNNGVAWQNNHYYNPASADIDVSRCPEYRNYAFGTVNSLNLHPECDPNLNDQGMFQAIGFMYRALELGLPLYWVINPNKEVTYNEVITNPDAKGRHAVDFSVTKSGANPAVAILHSGPSAAFPDYTGKTDSGGTSPVNYRGGPFVIDINDINALAGKDSDHNNVDDKQDFFDALDRYAATKFHIANYDFTVPVDKVMSGVPPHVAVLGEGYTGILLDYLKASGLGNDVYKIFTGISASRIIAGGAGSLDDYQLLWAPHWVIEGENTSRSRNFAPTPVSDQNALMAKIRAFLEAGNAGFFECASLESMEGSDNNAGAQVSGGGFLISSATQTPRMQVNKGLCKDLGSGCDQTRIVNEGVANYLNQCPGWVHIPTMGHVENFRPDQLPAAPYAYNSTVTRFIHDKDDQSATGYTPPGYDYFVGGRINGSPTQGYVAYLAGHQYIKCSNTGDVVPSERYLDLVFDRDITAGAAPRTVTIEIVSCSTGGACCTQGSTCPVLTIDAGTVADDLSVTVPTPGADAMDSPGCGAYISSADATYDGTNFTLSRIRIGNSCERTPVNINTISVAFPTDSLPDPVDPVKNPPAPARLLQVRETTGSACQTCDYASPPAVPPASPVSCTPASVVKYTTGVPGCDSSATTPLQLGPLITSCDIDWSSSTTCGTKFVLNTLMGLQFQIVPNEYNKAGNIAKNNVLYRGGFEYPGYKGHVKAFKISNGTSEPLFDAGKNTTMPRAGDRNPASPSDIVLSPATAARYLFTNLPGTNTPVEFEADAASTLCPYLLPDKASRCADAAALNEAKKWINSVRGKKGATDTDWNPATEVTKRLGGIEHSTMALMTGSSTVEEMTTKRPANYARKTITDAQGNYISGKNRDKVVFVGGDDGMLHAIYAGEGSSDECMNSARLSTGRCGKELWGYIPSTLLSSLRYQPFGECSPGDTTGLPCAAQNPEPYRCTQTTLQPGCTSASWQCKCPMFSVAAAVDSSPAIGDFYIDIDGDGKKEYRTVLVGSAVILKPQVAGDAFTKVNQGILFAFDVTDPYRPILMWEKTYLAAPANSVGIIKHYYPSGSVDASSDAAGFLPNIGIAPGPAIGRVQIGSNLQTYIFITSRWVDKMKDTSLPPKSASGFNVAALDFVTGDIVWETKLMYTGTAVDIDEVPAIPTLMDVDGNGTADYVLIGDMQGRLWALDTHDGTSKMPGGLPAYAVANSLDGTEANDTAGKYEPIGAAVGVYRDAAVFVTGGRDSLECETTTSDPGNACYKRNDIPYHVYVGGISDGAFVALSGWKDALGKPRPVRLAISAAGQKEKGMSQPVIDGNYNIYLGTSTGYTDLDSVDKARSASGDLYFLNIKAGYTDAPQKLSTLTGSPIGAVGSGQIDMDNSHVYLTTLTGRTYVIGGSDFTSSAAAGNPIKLLWWRKL